MSYLRLWNWFIDANAKKESNRLLAALLKKKYLSPRRLREWRDVWHQLGDLTRELGWTANAADATFEEIHSALLTGLLGNVGMRQLDADLKAPPFLGARGIHFWIWPGSALAKKAGRLPPKSSKQVDFLRGVWPTLSPSGLNGRHVTLLKRVGPIRIGRKIAVRL